MLYRPYGRRGRELSLLAFGAMGIAADPGLKNGVSGTLLKALEQGITLVDTARAYPQSEQIVAQTLREWRGERPTISTKIAPVNFEGFRFGGPIANYYPSKAIIDSIDRSLLALGTDHLDLVHLHQWHYRWTHELEWLDTLKEQQRAGKIGLIAVSAQDHEHDAVLEAVSAGLIDGVQVILNLFESRPLNALVPRASSTGAGVIARCALDSGGLTGLLNDEEFAARRFLQRAPVAEYRSRLQAMLADFVPSVAADLTELALRFAFTDPGVSSVTVGLMGDGQLKDALRAVAAGPLPEEVMSEIRRKHVWTKNFYEVLP